MKTENKFVIVMTIVVVALIIMPMVLQYYESGIEKSILDSVAHRSMIFYYYTVPTMTITTVAILWLFVTLMKEENKKPIKEGSKP